MKMKILAISDFHGRVPRISKQKIKFDILISPGDFSSSDKIRKIQFENWQDERRWYEIIGKTKAKKLVIEDIKSGNKVLEKVNKIGSALIVPGNAEYTGGDSGWSYLDKDYYSNSVAKLKNLVDVEYGLFDIGEVQVIGYGKSCAPEKEISRKLCKEIVKALGKLFKQAKKEKKPVVFVSHNVPYKVMDTITLRESPAYGMHTGSDVVRKIIKKYKPLLCVCGHMHESQGVERLGKTIVVNCGYGFNGEYAIIDIDGKNVDVELVKPAVSKKGRGKGGVKRGGKGAKNAIKKKKSKKKIIKKK